MFIDYFVKEGISNLPAGGNIVNNVETTPRDRALTLSHVAQIFQLNPDQLAILMNNVYVNRPNINISQNNYFIDQIIPRINVGRYNQIGIDNNGLNWDPILANVYAFENQVELAYNQVNYLFHSWPHLLYAYLVENTRIYDIFQKVIFEFQHGEKLGRPSQATQNWLLLTEQLFYNDPSSVSFYGLTSYLRPNLGSTRRNSYYRMFGYELNHGTLDNKNFLFHKPDDANREFRKIFEELLQEVCVGIEFAGSLTGNPTDSGAIIDLIDRMRNEFQIRRENGNLSREEFYFTSMMQWLHLILLDDTPVVRDLRANAATPDQRLKSIGNKVGIPCHCNSYNFFQIADLISDIIYRIEAGYFNDANSQLLYNPVAINGPLTYRNIMEILITQWSQATGRDMKAKAKALRK
jgi:hypothetical protein